MTTSERREFGAERLYVFITALLSINLECACLAHAASTAVSEMMFQGRDARRARPLVRAALARSLAPPFSHAVIATLKVKMLGSSPRSCRSEPRERTPESAPPCGVSRRPRASDFVRNRAREPHEPMRGANRRLRGGCVGSLGSRWRDAQRWRRLVHRCRHVRGRRLARGHRLARERRLVRERHLVSARSARAGTSAHARAERACPVATACAARAWASAHARTAAVSAVRLALVLRLAQRVVVRGCRLWRAREAP